MIYNVFCILFQQLLCLNNLDRAVTDSKESLSRLIPTCRVDDSSISVDYVHRVNIVVKLVGKNIVLCNPKLIQWDISQLYIVCSTVHSISLGLQLSYLSLPACKTLASFTLHNYLCIIVYKYFGLEAHKVECETYIFSIVVISALQLPCCLHAWLFVCISVPQPSLFYSQSRTKAIFVSDLSLFYYLLFLCQALNQNSRKRFNTYCNSLVSCLNQSPTYPFLFWYKLFCCLF